MRGADAGKRERELERLLRSHGLSVELRNLLDALSLAADVEPRRLLEEERVLREASARMLEQELARGLDPRPTMSRLEELRRSAGFGPPPSLEGLPCDGRFLIAPNGGEEVLEGRLVTTDGEFLHLLTEGAEGTGADEVSVLFACGEEIATCSCRVASVRELAPGLHAWALGMPPGSHDRARRHQRRVPLRLGARVVLSRADAAWVEEAQPLEEEEYTAAYLLDMSLGGVKLRVAAEVAPGDRVWVSVGRADRNGAEIELSGRVVWTAREEGFATAAAGIEFDAFDARTRQQVARFLNRRSSTAPRGPEGREA